MAAATDLRRKRFIVVTGKGGVGRTTVSAALGLTLARAGRRVLLLQANAQERLSLLFGSGPVGPQPLRLRDGLFAVNTTASDALHQYGLMVLRYETVYRMVLENPVSRSLLRAIPGLDDYSIIGKAFWHATREQDATGAPAWDTVIFDAPATGHAVTMLSIARAILDAVPEGPLTRDAVEVRRLLEDPARTSVVIVTLAEELPAVEAIELAAKLRDGLNLPVEHLVVNQVYPDRCAKGPVRVLESLCGGPVAEDPVLGPLVARACLMRSRRSVNDRTLAKLAAELPLHEVRLPMLFVPTLGPPELERLATLVEEQLGPGD